MDKHLTPIEKEFLIRAFRSNPNAKVKDFCEATTIFIKSSTVRASAFYVVPSAPRAGYAAGDPIQFFWIHFFLFHFLTINRRFRVLFF